MNSQPNKLASPDKDTNTPDPKIQNPSNPPPKEKQHDVNQFEHWSSGEIIADRLQRNDATPPSQKSKLVKVSSVKKTHWSQK